MAMVIQDLDAQLAACYDVISVLIMTRIVAHCQLQMTHAQVPVLTGFLDRLGLMLWPHFSRLIREHIDSITLGARHTPLRTSPRASLLRSRLTKTQRCLGPLVAPSGVHNSAAAAPLGVQTRPTQRRRRSSHRRRACCHARAAGRRSSHR